MMIDYNEMQIVYSFAPVALLAGVAGRFLIGGLIGGIIQAIISILSRPLWIGGIILLLLYYPDTVAWVLMKIGEIQIHIFAILLSAILPDLFPSADVKSWADIWNNAISVLPQNVVDTMASLDLAGMLGMITSCLTAGFTIKIYMRLIKRAGLL